MNLDEAVRFQDSNLEHFLSLDDSPPHSLSEYLRRRDLVLHVRYDSRLEEGRTDVEETALSFDKRGEGDVFGVECPSDPYQGGYRGECEQIRNITQEEVAEQVWNVMARTGSENCRRLLKETFCAFKVFCLAYNSIVYHRGRFFEINFLLCSTTTRASASLPTP